jgi:hypothetical protein
VDRERLAPVPDLPEEDTGAMNNVQYKCEECGMPVEECYCYDDGYAPSCTHCGGEGFMEANEMHCDWINFGDEYESCMYCRGTGLRKHQTVF